MLALEELINLPEESQEALGTTATAGEIAQQPATWRGTRKIFKQHAERLRAFLEAAGVTGPLERRPTVVLTGAGTSDYIGQSLALVLRSCWGCETQAIASTDLLLNMSDQLVPGRRYLMISFSRSGDSPEGVAVLQRALERYPEIAHLIVTCNEKGRMAELVDGRDRAYAVILDDAVNDRGLAMTSSFTNMVVFGQCLAHTWSEATYEPVFEALVSSGERFLPIADAAARELAEKKYRRVCVLGSGALTGVARESALKVLELTAGGVKTMAESVLGLRHGPMAALDKETLLVCFLSSDSRRQSYEADLLREVGEKEIVAQRVVVGPPNADHLVGCSEQYLAIGHGVPDLYRPPVDVMLGQLLGLYSSLAQGLKPDAPSPRGVISRVVGEFRIYEHCE
ncbi:SIS domain-containing protein [Granulicella sp. S190]|uniref:SIS domain-containing protein n=1 Tax=Granulicella sp. S190 TaxID=1747226 RepID=UPI0020B149EE|nr:SIS domain-containing protein [Granulicella sp. S190]